MKDTTTNLNKIKKENELLPLLIAISYADKMDFGNSNNQYIQSIIDYTLYRFCKFYSNLYPINTVNVNKENYLNQIKDILKNKTNFYKYMENDIRANKLFFDDKYNNKE